MYDSVVEAFADKAEKLPDKLCLADGVRAYTYKEGYNRICQYAAVLKNHGVHQGDALMAECTQDSDYMLLIMAMELTGAVFVPVEKNASQDRLEEIREDVAPVLYFYKKRNLLPNVTGMSYIELDKEVEGSEPYVAERFPNREATCEILFSTGTTGQSKGIEITNGNNIALCQNVMYGVEMKENNVELIPMPLSHSNGLRRTYANLYNGSTAVFISSMVFINKFYGLMDKYHVTSLAIAPSILSIIFKLSGDKIGEYNKALDYIQIGSAPLEEHDKQHLCKLLPNTRLYNFYGSTEAGCSCILEFSKDAGRKHCIGKPTCNSKFIVVDEERREIDNTSAEHTGYLACGGAMSMEGYWKNPELTDEVMENGYIYSADEGYIDKEGYVYMLGRKDDVINFGGVKISPEEIEAVAAEYEGVKDCGCIPIADEVSGQRPKLFVSLSDSAGDFSTAELNAYLTAHLDGNKVPKDIQVIDEIPRTFNGKLQRKLLKQLAEASQQECAL